MVTMIEVVTAAMMGINGDDGDDGEEEEEEGGGGGRRKRRRRRRKRKMVMVGTVLVETVIVMVVMTRITCWQRFWGYTEQRSDQKISRRENFTSVSLKCSILVCIWVHVSTTPLCLLS